MSDPNRPGDVPPYGQQPGYGQPGYGQPGYGQPGQQDYRPAPSGYPLGIEPQRPKRRLLKIGLLIMVAGIVLGALLGYVGYRSFPDIDGFPRAEGVDQPVELTAGEWTVFSEGNVFGPNEITAPDGTPIEIGILTSSQKYTVNGREGVGIGTVDLPVDGTYFVDSPDGATAFAQSFGTNLAQAVLLFLAAALVGGGLFLIGGILSLIGLFKRS